MHDALSSRLLPHEWVFGGFLAATGLGLAFVAGPFARDTLVFLGSSRRRSRSWLGARPSPVWAGGACGSRSTRWR